MKLAFEYSEPTSFDVMDSFLAIVMWLLTEIPGNAMMIWIIMFEKYGGDPLKRRISDQVFFFKKNHRHEIRYSMFQNHTVTDVIKWY